MRFIAGGLGCERQELLIESDCMRTGCAIQHLLRVREALGLILSKGKKKKKKVTLWQPPQVPKEAETLRSQLCPP